MISSSFLENYILDNIIPKEKVSQIGNLTPTVGSNKAYLKLFAQDFKIEYVDSISEFEEKYTAEVDFSTMKLFSVAKSERLLPAKEKITNLNSNEKDIKILGTSNVFAKNIHLFDFDKLVVMHDDIIQTFLPNNLDLKEQYSEKEANEYIDKILELAVNKNASDIHIESSRQSYGIRLRIGTYLSEVLDTRPIQFMDIVFRILRFRCNIDTSSNLQSLKGAFRSVINNKEYSWRFQLVQTTVGLYKVTLRKTHDFSGEVSLVNLNYYPKVLSIIKDTMNIDRGMILFSGVTGSGKTTTLYSTLYELATKHHKSVFTLEDPVESVFPEFTQVQTSRTYSYADGISDALRSNPDCLLIGEIRNLETAQAAFNAAITGHKAYSTLHVGSVGLVGKRLTGLGLEEDIIMQNLLCIFIQRKVTKLCKCKTYNDKTKHYEANTSDDNNCPICSKTTTKGYFSIVPINEVALIKENSTELTNTSFKEYIPFDECLKWHLEVGNIDEQTFNDEVKALNVLYQQNNKEFKERFDEKKALYRNRKVIK